MATVRLATPEDAEAIGRIAYATGFFGDSAAVFFPDPDLFMALWVEPYLAGQGCCNFVAESREQVRGYIIGACDAASYRRSLVLAGMHAAGGILTGRYRQRRRCLRYLWRMARFGTGSAPLSDYPAHLHINLLPGTRGRGLGSALLRVHLACLAEAGVPGVQVSTTRENRGALKLYRRSGFRIFSERSSPLWRPWLGRSTSHVVLVRQLESGDRKATGRPEL